MVRSCRAKAQLGTRNGCDNRFYFMDCRVQWVEIQANRTILSLLSLGAKSPADKAVRPEFPIFYPVEHRDSRPSKPTKWSLRAIAGRLGTFAIRRPKRERPFPPTTDPRECRTNASRTLLSAEPPGQPINFRLEAIRCFPIACSSQSFRSMRADSGQAKKQVSDAQNEAPETFEQKRLRNPAGRWLGSSAFFPDGAKYAVGRFQC